MEYQSLLRPFICYKNLCLRYILGTVISQERTSPFTLINDEAPRREMWLTRSVQEVFSCDEATLLLAYVSMLVLCTNKFAFSSLLKKVIYAIFYSLNSI